MNEIALTAEAMPSDLSAISTEDLRAALSQAIGVTARTLGRLALIWQELEARGEDMSALRGGGLFFYLPLIAAGQLAPEAVVRCAGQATLLKHLASLPLEEQRDVLDRGLPLADVVNDTVVTHHKALEEVSITDIRRAFVGDRLRTIPEQTRMLAPSQRRSAAPDARAVILKVRLSKEEYAGLRRRAAASGQQTPTFARDVLLRGE